MSAISKHFWHVSGMDCASCVAKVTKAVERLPGVSEVEVNLMSERLALRLKPGSTDPEAIERQVEALGYTIARTPDANADVSSPARSCEGHDHGGVPHAHVNSSGIPFDHHWYLSPKARLVWFLGALVLATWALGRAFADYAQQIYLVATLIGILPFGKRAIALALAGSPFSIETLMATAALGAVAIGAAEEAAVVILLFAIGEMLEGVAAGRARAGIRALVSLMPSTALRRGASGTFETVSADHLRVADIVLVRPGDRIACDGEIVEGNAEIDESPVTGESVPVARGPGDRVIAGSINAMAALTVSVTHAGADSTLARIARMVEAATVSRGRTQRFIERFSNVWTPAAMGVAILIVVVPPVFFDGDWTTWIYRGLAVLLVACPCALVISVPAAMASGLSAGARHGLLVKGSAALEAIGSAKTVAFDKTGTLTAGKPQVTDIMPVSGYDQNDVLRLAAGVEAGSSHPLARAIVAEAGRRNVVVPASTAATAIPGKAISAIVGGRSVGIGSPTWADGIGADLPDQLVSTIATLEESGKTVAVVAVDGKAVGLIALRDEPRADATDGIDALRRLGVASIMLTGDNPRTGAAIASRLGLEVKAGLSPAGKLAEIVELKSGGAVVMVGDGINDAPALAAATAGIAMGGGTDVALETADAALMKERVTGVAELVALSRATLANVRQNVAIAVGLKLVFLLTTVTGTTGLWIAILADTGATILVTLNALRLLGWSRKRGG